MITSLGNQDKSRTLFELTVAAVSGSTQREQTPTFQSIFVRTYRIVQPKYTKGGSLRFNLSVQSRASSLSISPGPLETGLAGTEKVKQNTEVLSGLHELVIKFGFYSRDSAVHHAFIVVVFKGLEQPTAKPG